jgi:hypothetical protein
MKAGTGMRAPAYACRRVVPKNGISSSDQSAEVAHPTRFERVTFAFGEQGACSMVTRGGPGTASRSTWFTLWVGLKGTYTSELHLKSLPIPATP